MELIWFSASFFGFGILTTLCVVCGLKIRKLVQKRDKTRSDQPAESHPMKIFGHESQGELRQEPQVSRACLEAQNQHPTNTVETMVEHHNSNNPFVNDNSSTGEIMTSVTKHKTDENADAKGNFGLLIKSSFLTELTVLAPCRLPFICCLPPLTFNYSAASNFNEFPFPLNTCNFYKT